MPPKKENGGETPKDYYYRLFKAKKSGDEWARRIPCDSHVYFADSGQEEKVNTLCAQQRKKCYGE